MKIYKIITAYFLLVALPLHAEPVRLLVFGDSFASGYGLPEADGFCPQLERKLEALDMDVDVINAAIAGETSIGALMRSAATFEVEHDFVFLEMGANDMLRGFAPDLTKRNLGQIIETSEKPVFLTGIRAFPTYGKVYTERFDAIYPSLAEQWQTGFYPFLFEAVFEDGAANGSKYFQADRLHLNKAGIEQVIEDLAPELKSWMLNEPRLRTH